MRLLIAFLVLLTVSTTSLAAAEPLKTFISSFSVVGAANGSALQTVLPSLLLSRLPPEQFTPVASRDSADIEIAGSYVVFGRSFTLDAAVRKRDGTLLMKGFEVGEREDDAPAALGRLAARIGRELAREPAPPANSAPQPALPAPLVLPPAAVAKPGQQGFRELWSSQPLSGALKAIATGKKLLNGEREIFIAGERTLFYYLLGSELKQVAAVELPVNFRVIALDAADLDGDGTTEIYLTAIDREALASQVYTPQAGALLKVKGDLPWFFRRLTLNGTAHKIYTQELGMDSDFYGAIGELVKNGATFSTKPLLKLPETGMLYNFSPLTTAASGGFAIITSDGHLSAVSTKGEQLWQSSERFGGSETLFKREADQQHGGIGDGYRWIYLQQRQFVTASGSLLLPRNEGTMVVGNLRDYNRHSFHLLTWSGAAFRQQLQSGQRPGYLADFAFDPASNELLTLEVVQKEGFLSAGRSTLSVIKLDQQ